MSLPYRGDSEDQSFYYLSNLCLIDAVVSKVGNVVYCNVM